MRDEEVLKEDLWKAWRLVEWLADQPCSGNGSSVTCRENSPDDPSWCCNSCKAWLITYGPVQDDPHCTCPEWWFPPNKRRRLKRLPHGGALSHHQNCTKRKIV